MSAKNRNRKAANRRRRADAAAQEAAVRDPAADSGAGASPNMDGDLDQGARIRAVVLEAMAVVTVDGSFAHTFAERLGAQSSTAVAVAADTVESLLAERVAATVAEGWTPYDLAQVVRRRLSGRHLPVLATALTRETDRHRPDQVAAQWRAELAALDRPPRTALAAVVRVELGLGLCAVLGLLPPVPTVLAQPGSPVEGPRVTGHGDAKQLARVRALLAKAESTPYDAEAESLSAKAQELISRHAIDKLLDDAGQREETGTERPVHARRLWIDAPYVVAKALLIQAVAAANRCSSVISESLGFSTVIGGPDDLDAVEMLATSLLVQADAAMLRRGSSTGRWRASRTTSFRRSFLVSFATRIGERLNEATTAAVEQAGAGGALVPLLDRRREQVDDACHRWFPHVVSRATRISNAEGWTAGRAAADLARLDAGSRPLPAFA